LSCATAAAPAARTGRNAKETGLRNLTTARILPNQLWCELLAMASELLAWM